MQRGDNNTVWRKESLHIPGDKLSRTGRNNVANSFIQGSGANVKRNPTSSGTWDFRNELRAAKWRKLYAKLMIPNLKSFLLAVKRPDSRLLVVPFGNVGNVWRQWSTFCLIETDKG